MSRCTSYVATIAQVETQGMRSSGGSDLGACFASRDGLPRYDAVIADCSPVEENTLHATLKTEGGEAFFKLTSISYGWCWVSGSTEPTQVQARLLN